MSNDLTLGELHADGKLGNSVAQLYGRLLGTHWREYPVSIGHEAIAFERERHQRGIDLRGKANTNHRAA